uniref:Protein kinase domain-containing protein n=1 Tax=Knipowitschia caucasica TaxID=637954 RepID=A0AAV2JNY6_KNICA
MSSLIPKNFTIKQVLGEGAYGKVVRCVTEVAVKVPHNLAMKSAAMMEMRTIVLLVGSPSHGMLEESIETPMFFVDTPGGWRIKCTLYYGEEAPEKDPEEAPEEAPEEEEDQRDATEQRVSPENEGSA